MTGPFGRIVTTAQVETAVLDTLKRFLPHYLAEVERQTNLAPTAAAPRAYRVWTDRETWPSDQLPAVIVACPGTTDTRRTPRGYEADWDVRVGVIVRTSDQASTRRLAGIYAAAARAVLVQRPALGGLATATIWVGDQIDTEPDTGQTWGLGTTQVTVTVPQVIDPDQGPIWPDHPDIPDPAEPWDDWAQISQVDTTVIHKEDDDV